MTLQPELELFAEKTRKVLYPDQEQAIQMLRDALREGHTRVVLRLATGGGKTVIAGRISESAIGRGKRVAFTVPMVELIDQTVERFLDEGIERIGVIQADHPRKDRAAPMQICSVQTLARRELPQADIVLVDECHIRSEVILKWMKAAPEVIFIGLSATPWRKGMASEYTKLVEPVPMHELMRRGRLSRYRIFAVSHPDLGNVKTVRGDYDPEALAQVMSDGALLADICQTWMEKGEGRPTICFCVDRAHAKKIQAQFQSHGINAGYVDAYTDKIERREIHKAFARGAMPIVCNVGVLTTGLDWDVRCIIGARPTRSEMLWVQMFGRGLRIAPGKEDLLYLDHTDNILRLGRPEDITYPFLLTGKETKDRLPPAPPLPKACPQCGFVKEPKVKVCPGCGFVPEARSDVDPLDGELVEVGKQPGGKPMTPEQKRMWFAQLLWIGNRRAADGKTRDGTKWALAKFVSRVGSFPAKKNGVQPEPPCREIVNWVRSQDIRYAKAQEAKRKSQGASQ